MTACGAVVVVAGGGLAQHYWSVPGPRGGPPPGQTHTVAAFHRIVMPDLVVIEPAGLDAPQLAGLGKIRGLRQLLAVDGASITVGGQTVNAIGVNVQQYRSWTPLRTAYNQRLWTALASGGFLASPQLRHQLRFHTGTSYQLHGAGVESLVFGGAASLGLGGIDLVVSNRASAGLGLIHNVAALISAPGVGMSRLKREVRRALGGTGKIIGLRSEQLPVDPGGAGRPSTYLELFQASAARYCPGLSWTVLAAIGQIESADGANMGPSSAGALGPMQFMPDTWQRWGITAFGEPGPPNILDPYDAVPSAARYLCAAGASTPAGLPGAIFAYNHADWYVSEVLALAKQYAAQAHG